MRFPRFTKYLALTASLGLLGSCDDFLNVNQSPNSVLNPQPTNILVSAETQLSFLMGSDIHRYSSLFVQQFAGQGGLGTQTVEFDRYNITATDINNLWRTNLYGGALADAQKLITQTESTSPAYSGIGKIMQGFLFAIAADAFGDVPLEDALKFEENVKPRYQSSEAVYAGALALLDAGIADLGKNSTLKPGADDLIYNGDLDKWIRFANTVKLRLFIHHYPKLSSQATTRINALLSSNALLMRNVGDNFQMRFEATSGRQNPIDQFENRRQSTFFPSTTLVNLMNSTNDPRRPTYFTLAPSSTQYIGVQNGTGVVQAVNFSRMNTYLRGALTGTAYAGDAPIRMFTYAEYQFILAEHNLRTGNAPVARTFFENGIRASMEMAGVAAADVTTYVTARSAAFAAATAQADALRLIIEEKFVANYGVAMEPWSDWRRTGFPALSLASNAVLARIPRILPYSDLERVTNPENTPARTPADLITPKVFWDPGQ
ncbi:SusD/RagB family nutrient-binding outer membrane lipoprotein [Hymenobacter weizhouensis]|uniref:SusD/RagB family nutrient-binding outer membrane lipoprotein n=1 Tax=Hymenobacter sp. YIM 151500-1 TaxID=2987689 RepID=UPI00222629B0|nr:SusD/RagB family nutrient-binding outer membrane lipoprotein [Hymenobacter sp. YIM 151500-1]UYZ63266.1 SusD/RagB family nutrient-binding outer membrane lipoprotein [Hymenobacter sp. YIM 151500-1]